MDLLNLQGKLTLDTSEYEAAIQRAVQLGNSTFAGGIQSVAGSTQQLQSAMTGAGTQAQAFGQQMQVATQQTSSFGAMVKNAVSVTLGNLFTKAITNASHALMGFAKQSISTGMSFDSAMSQVAATMGVTTDEVQELREYAEKMGATTAFSATQSAEALNYMALAGYDAEKSMKMLPNVLNLAASGGMQLARASDMVTDAQSALGLSTEQTTEMVNQMAMAASKSNTSVEQLGDAILQIGGTAKKLKGGTTELATILGILADNGMKGAEGGTHLRNMMNSLMSPTSKATKMMDELGISLYDADGNMRSLNDVFLDMRNAMEQMATQEERDKVVSTIFNARDMKAAEALLAGVGDRYQELAGYIDQAADSAQDMADTKLDNLQGDITLFKSAVEGAQIAISEKLTPSLRKFTQFGSKAVSEVSQAFQSNGLTGAISAAHKAISEGFGKKATAAIFAAEAAIKAFAVGFAAIKAGDAIKGIAKTFSNISAAISTATGATAAQTAAQAASTTVTITNTAAQAAGAAAANTQAVAQGNVAAATASTTTVTVANTAATTAQTTAQTAGASAAAKFGAALSAVGMAASAAAVVGTALASIINSYTDAMDEVGEVMEGLVGTEKEFVDSIYEAKKALADSEKSYRSTIREVEVEEKTTQKLVERLYELNDSEEKTAEVKAEMSNIVDQLNGSIEGLNIKYDKEAGIVKTTRTEVDKLTESYYKQAKAQAYKDIYSETVKKQTEAELALADAQKLKDDKQREYENNKWHLNNAKLTLENLKAELKAEEDNAEAALYSAEASKEHRKRLDELTEAVSRQEQTVRTINDAYEQSRQALVGNGGAAPALREAQATYDSYTERLQMVEEKQYELTGTVQGSVEEIADSMGTVGEAAMEMQNTIVAAEDGTITAYATLGARTLELNEQEITSIAEAIDAYDTLYEARREAIEKSVDLYKGFEADTSTTYTDLWNNLNESAFYLNDWTTAIEQLQAKVDKGLMSQDFLDSLKDMGLDSWNIVYDMNHATSGQLQQYSNLWDETTANMEKATERIMAKDTETTEAFLGSVSKISGADIQQYRDMFEKIGTNVTGGFAKGVEESIEKAREANEKLAEESVDTLTEELEEHSPSKVTEKIGYFFDMGLADGILKNMGPVANAARNLAIKAYNAMVEALEIDSPSKLTEKLGAFTGQGFALGMKGEENDVLTASQLLAQSAVEPLEGLTPVVSTAGVKPAGDAAGARESSPTTIILQVDGRTLGQASFSTINELLGRQTIFDVGGYART